MLLTTILFFFKISTVRSVFDFNDLTNNDPYVQINATGESSLRKHSCKRESVSVNRMNNQPNTLVS